MNKFLNSIFFENTGTKRAKSPLMGAFNVEESHEFLISSYQTLFQLKLNWVFDAWLNENEVENRNALYELRLMAIKRLHHEIYGDIENYLHELQMYLHQEDFENSKKVVDLIKLCVRGD